MSAANNNSIISNASMYGVKDGISVANMIDGAQLGVGLVGKNLDAATPLVYIPTMCVVLKTPSMYDSTPDVGKMIKALIECHAKSVSGIDFEYSLETHQEPAGHDGQQMEVPLKSKRSEVSPTFTFYEVVGNLVASLFTKWMCDISHPDTNASIITSTSTPHTMSKYAMSMLAIQFGPTMDPDTIMDAAFYTNMYPKNPGGQRGFGREIGVAKALERSVVMSGLVIHNDTVTTLAKSVATKLKAHKVDYNKTALGVTEIASAIADSGTQKVVDDLINSES